MSASGEVWPSSLRDEARMNIHGVVSVRPGGVVSVGNPEGLHYVWRKPDGETRWGDLQKLLEKLAKDHKIKNRVGLEDAVDAAAQIYHHQGVLPKADVKRLLGSISQVTRMLREENDARIADILVDRDNHLIKGAAWKPGASGRIDRILKLESSFLFNPISPRTAVHRRLLRRNGFFDGWESSYERAVAIRMRLFRIRADLAQLSRALERIPKTRTGNMQLLGAVAVLKRRWKSLSGKKVGMPKFVESVIAFVDPTHPDVAAKLRSAMRLRLKGVAKIRT